MDFHFTEEQRMIQGLAREFADKEIRPLAKEIDKSCNVPAELIEKMAELGFMGVAVPQEYGGAGMDSISLVIAMEEIARACASTATVMTVNNSLVCEPILRYGSEDQKKRFLTPLASGEVLGCFALTEAEAGSDAASIKTTATEDGNSYIINGSKLFVSNGQTARVAIVFAVTDAAKGHKGISAFILEKGAPGFSIGRIEDKLGIKGSETVEFVFDGCRIPRENLLGDVGQGFKIAMDILDAGRIGIAAQSLGIAQSCLDEAVKYSRERIQFGKPIANLQAIQFMISDMAMEMEGARLLTYRAASLKDKDLRFVKEASMAKLYASEMANRAAYRALQIHGGYGYIKDFPVERYYRDARITTIYEGTSEIQRLTIARELLRSL